MPQVQRLDSTGKPLADDAPAEAVAFTEYTVEIRPGIEYQPHPAFAKDGQDRWRYWPLPASA